jgi:hypothetical protein
MTSHRVWGIVREVREQWSHYTVRADHRCPLFLRNNDFMRKAMNQICRQADALELAVRPDERLKIVHRSKNRFKIGGNG